MFLVPPCCVHRDKYLAADIILKFYLTLYITLFLLHRQHFKSLQLKSATVYSIFLVDKIKNILNNITPSASLQIPCVSRPVTLENFFPITIDDLTKVVSSMKSYCLLDVVTTVLFKNVIGMIGPCVLSVINN